MKKDNPDDKWLSANTVTDEPELESWEVEYVEYFYLLSSSRASGMGVGAIPLSEILMCCDFFGITPAEDFIRIMQTADSAYLEEHRTAEDARSK